MKNTPDLSQEELTPSVRIPDGGFFKLVDAVTIPVANLDSGIAFYCDVLGHDLKWRNDAVGQAGVRLPEGKSELVLSTNQGYEPNWLVESVDDAVELFRVHGKVLSEPEDIPVGRLSVVQDPFENTLVILDLSKGTYATDDHGDVTGVEHP